MAIKTLVLTIAGFSLLGLGIVGAALPVMPTTPFVLLSAICFTGSNQKFAAWLTKTKYFGSFIENYREKRGVPLKVKIAAIAFLWGGLAVSFVLTQNSIVHIVLPIVGACVTLHIALLKTRRPKIAQTADKNN